MNLFELYFSARKRYVKWCDDRKRRKGEIEVIFSDNAYTAIMVAIEGVQNNLDDHLEEHHAVVRPAKVPAAEKVEDKGMTYEEMEKRLVV